MKRCLKCGCAIEWTYGGYCWDCWDEMANRNQNQKPQDNWTAKRKQVRDEKRNRRASTRTVAPFVAHTNAHGDTMHLRSLDASLFRRKTSKTNARKEPKGRNETINHVLARRVYDNRRCSDGDGPNAPAGA